MVFFEYTVMLAPIYFLRNRKKFLTSAFLLGLAVHVYPKSLVYVSVLAHTFMEKGTLNRKSFFLYLALAFSATLILGALTDYAVGKEGVRLASSSSRCGCSSG